MFVFLLILISSPFLFYKIGNTSLTPWDEAWYAEIAGNILETGRLFTLSFNGGNFLDHPPAGFWFIAISEKIFGQNSLGARFGSAFFGLFTIVAVYFLGKKLFSKSAGFFSALALLSAPWFLTRARSGNLDIFLTFFYVLTVYLAILVNEEKKYLKYFFISLTFLFLTKTMVPLTIIPTLILIFWKSNKLKFTDFFKPILIPTILVSYWFYLNYKIAPDKFISNYLRIGLTGVGRSTSPINNISLVKTYVHNGIGNWFRFAILGTFGGLFLKDGRFFVLALLTGSILFPFIFSEKGHIWHMIPAYPFLLLSLFGFIFVVSEKYSKIPILKYPLVLILFLYFFIPQMGRNYREFINVPSYISDEEILSREAGKYSEKLILDDDFIPTAVFYSGKNVERTVVSLREYFNKEENFLMIVREFKLNSENVKPEEYEVIKKDRDKLLIRKK